MSAALAPKSFRWAIDGAVATITLDRPERKNALTFEIYGELRDTFRALADAGDIRAVVLTGAGGDFCSGGDVHEIIGPLVEMDAAGRLEFTRMTGDLVKAMRACPQPIVAAVDGVAAGAGAIIAMVSDIRLGTARARVSFLFTRVGLGGCDMGACAILPRIVGHGRASELLFTGRAMDGAEAERCGFFARLCDPDALQSEVRTLAHEIATGPARAHATTKRMLHAEWAMALDDAIDAEARAQALLMGSDDFAIAYRAFLERSRPAFEGR